jgi:hypothetical protein
MKEERKIHVARRTTTEDDSEKLTDDEVNMVEAIVREAFEGYSAA